LPETMGASPVKTQACLEKKEPIPEETEAMEKFQEVPNGATEDQSRDLRLAVGCHAQLKTWTKCDGGFRQECATAVRRPTRRTVPAVCKGRLCKGPGKKCRSGIQGRGITSGSGMRGMIRKHHRRLEGKKMHCEATRQSLHLEIARLLVESSIRLREPGDRILWKCQPPPKWKRSCHSSASGSDCVHPPPQRTTEAAAVRRRSRGGVTEGVGRKEENVGNWYRLLGTSSLKEGAVWRAPCKLRSHCHWRLWRSTVVCTL
jgi:hypothetical protein